MVKTIILVGTLFILTLLNGYSQQETKHIRQGNNLYSDQKYNASEIEYRKALEQNSSSIKGNYNLAGSLYKQNKYDEAGEIYKGLTSSNASKEELAKYYHNLGNSYLMNKKLEESIEAYKNALRNSPNDSATKYNLAYAQSLLNQQQQQQQQNKDQNQQNQNKDQKDQDNQDKQQQDKQDQQDKQNQQEPQNQQQQQGLMSKEDAERILQALQNNEKQTKENLEKQKVQPAGIYVEKNW
jgi:Ca-activated chloride channel homolog